MEVPCSLPEGFYLRDVINRLNFLRGKGNATMYYWSSKRYISLLLLDGVSICKSNDSYSVFGFNFQI
ncbi:hypothetical protein ACSBR2_012755 [Camellia fascicularis]